MVAGALIQLVTACNDIDLMLVGNPETSFFKSVYMRHTNFSIHTKKTTFYNGSDFGKIARCVLSNGHGDLISKITLNIKLNSLNKDIINYGWINSIGHALIKNIWIEIGGHRINQLSGEWLDIWSELTIPEEKRRDFYRMIGKTDKDAHTVETFSNKMDLYIPLEFWFSKDIASSIPIFCIRNQEVDLVVEFRKFDQCWIKKDVNPPPVKVKFDTTIFVKSIYLDTQERKNMLKKSHTYIFEDVQMVQYQLNMVQKIKSLDLPFKNPIKELIWTLQNTNNKILFDYGIEDIFNRATLKINKDIIFDKFDASYFRLIEPYHNHTRSPCNNIYTYSLCLNPEELQPSGHLNLSNIKTAQLILYLDSDKKRTFDIKIYAISYNFLMITDGSAHKLF